MAGTQRTASRASYAGSLDVPNPNANNAALLGASKAFGKPTPPNKPTPSPKPSNATPSAQRTSLNGALSAATAAGQRSKTNSPEHLSPGARSGTPYNPSPASVRSNVTGSNVMGSNVTGNNATGQRGMKRNSLEVRGKSPAPPSPPDSALLAAQSVAPAPTPAPPLRMARTGDGGLKRRPAAPPKPRRLSLHRRTSSNDSIHRPETSPTLPTTSLVDLFEKKSEDSVPTRKFVNPIVIKPHPELAIKSPQPVRVSDGFNPALQARMDPGGPAEAAQHEGGRQEAFPPVAARQAQGRRGKAGPGVSKAGRASPGTRRSPRRGTPAQILDDGEPSSAEEAYFSASEDTAPSPDPPAAISHRDSSVRTNLVPPTPPTEQPPRPSPSPLRNSHNRTSTPIDMKPPSRTTTATSESSHSSKSLAATYHQLYPRRGTTSLTTDSDLANAMVASNLASHRHPSPRIPSPPPPRRGHLPFHSRTPSPSKKGLRHTLRGTSPSSSDSEDSANLHPYAKHKKKRHLRPKHPNKHHEGARKRWREAVTERERRRYEGVWAANKGLHCSFTPSEIAGFYTSPGSPHTRGIQAAAADQVSNLVVRDLWARSRLPPQELEAIWDLVDGGQVGRLDKEEFVTGLWLVDQRLKGRKLPQKVSPTVWASVRGVQGIKVKKFVER